MSNPENGYDEEITATQSSDDSDDYDEVDVQACLRRIIPESIYDHDQEDLRAFRESIGIVLMNFSCLICLFALNNYIGGKTIGIFAVIFFYKFLTAYCKNISKTAGIFVVNFFCFIAGVIGYLFTCVCCKGRDVCARIFGSSIQHAVKIEASDHGNSSREISSREGNCKIIGFDGKARGLLDKLVGGWKKLEVISITGMGGIGKTTLAYSLYNDPNVVNHFHLRGWCTVSQFCPKRKLLHDILSCFLNENDPIFTMSAEDMGEKLYKTLKGKTYFIVLDDMWDIDAWNDVKICFPKDGNGSRILVTTRINDVALNVSCSCPPHSLSFYVQMRVEIF